jgi:hypothetical protein
MIKTKTIPATTTTIGQNDRLRRFSLRVCRYTIASGRTARRVLI